MTGDIDISMTNKALINTISLISLLGRTLLLLLILLLWYAGGFRPDELKQLALALVPISLVLIGAFLYYVIEFPYPIRSIHLSMRMSYFGWFFALLLYSCYAVCIGLTGVDRSLMDFEQLTTLLLIGEGICAIYCGTFLSRLFRLQSE